MKKALILHAYTNTPEGNWYPWLKSELEKKGYEVWTPLLPTMDSPKPNMKVMLKVILEKKFVDSDSVVVGHSLGSLLALR